MSTRTITPIDLYVSETVRKLQQHNNTQQLVVILRDLRELVVDINAELTNYHISQIKEALEESLGRGWAHIAEWQPFDDEDGESVPAPVDDLADAMSELGMKSAWFQLGEPERNVGEFLRIGQPIKIMYSDFEGNVEDEDQPVTKLTLAWIEETRARLASNDDHSGRIDFELTVPHMGWSIRRYLRDYVSGFDPEEILYVFGAGADYVQASLTIKPDTLVREVDGLLVIEECEMNVKFGFMLESDDFGISSKMIDRGWDEHTETDIEVTRIAFDPETNSVVKFEVQD